MTVVSITNFAICMFCSINRGKCAIGLPAFKLLVYLSTNITITNKIKRESCETIFERLYVFPYSILRLILKRAKIEEKNIMTV
jgi:hypothetical protein